MICDLFYVPEALPKTSTLGDGGFPGRYFYKGARICAISTGSRPALLSGAPAVLDLCT